MSTTMIETFDTPMFDYQNDHDFSMQVSSSDVWLQDEAVMQDDGQAENANISIEVDMEPYEEQPNPEYEMADDSETFALHSTELEDVEVYNASRAHSPNMFSSDETHESPASHHNTTHPTSDFQEQQEPVKSPHLSPSQPQTFDTATYLTASPMVSLSVQQIEVVADVHGPSPSSVPSSILAILEEPAAESTLDSTTLDSNKTSIEEQQGLEGGELAPTIELVIGTDIAHDHDGGATSLGDQLETQEDAGTQVEGRDSSGVSTGDPHEISEGVYIDPPPAVLLAFSTNIPPVSLFNVPSRSRLHSPHGGLDDAPGGGTSEPDPIVLLGHHPTLYYEPLSSVFEALRQVEYLTSIPDLLYGELLLDAYDLELVMSEDFTYAHELSLHDLNVLHDGLNKHGPLRLRLKTRVPRFIDRFHILQEQITHLNEAVPPEPLSEGHHHEEDAERLQLSPIIEQHTEEQAHERGKEDHQAELEEAHDQEGGEKLHTYVDEYSNAEQETIEETSLEHPILVQVIDGISNAIEGDSLGLGISDSEKDAIEGDTLPIVQIDGESEFFSVNDEGAEEYHHPRDENVDEDSVAPLSVEENLQEEVETIFDGFSEDHVRAEENASPRPTEQVSEGTSEDDDVLTHNDFQPIQSVSLEDPVCEKPEFLYSSIEDRHDINVSDVNRATSQVPSDNNANSLKDSTTEDPNLEAKHPDDFDSETWGEFDGEGEVDLDWEVEEPEHDTSSIESSCTLSSKSSSKRSLFDAELEDYQDDDFLLSASPGSKRPRVE